MVLFDRVTIVGLGLIGGSLGMALKRRRLAERVVGVSRRAATIRQAKRRRAIDEGTTDARLAVRDADLVVLAAPVDVIARDGARLAAWMRAGSILTDVGSTKARIVRTLERALPRQVAFVGAHPLAGSEQRGIAAARADLFDGSVCVLTPTSRTSRAALNRVRRLWAALAERVIAVSPTAHDRLLAEASHLPHLLAFALSAAASPAALAIAPRSFLEATRVAKSDPDLWDDIFLSNREALLHALDRFDERCRQARRLLARGERRGLLRYLRHAQALRRRLPG